MLNSREKSLQGYFRMALVLAALGLGSTVAHAQAASDWQRKWEKILGQARSEAKVMVLGPPGEIVRNALTDGFRRAYPGIDFAFAGASGGQLASKVRAEREGGVFTVDVVVSGTSTANIYFKPMKALEPIAPALVLPEVVDIGSWRDRTHEFSDNERKYNLVFGADVYPVAIYDPQQARPDEIDDPYKLLDPKWKGKILINDPLPSGPGKGAFRWLWQVLGPEKAQEFFRKIRDQAGTVDRDQRRQVEWIAQGKYAVLMGPNMPVASQLAQRGLKFAILPEFKAYGTYITSGYASAVLMNRAPHPNAAKVFLNWLLTREGQTVWSKSMGQASRRTDVSTDHLPTYAIPKPGAMTWSASYKAGDRYWLSYQEETLHLNPEQEKFLKEHFGR